MTAQGKRVFSMSNHPEMVILVLALLSVIVGGCTTKFTTSTMHPQSHFDFPNSNVIPLGLAKASTEGDCQDAGLLIKKATEQAIASKGGDLLVNYTAANVISVTVIPFLPVPIVTCETRVEGTAAKMEIGRRPLQ